MRADINQTDIASKDTAAADCSGRPRRRERERERSDSVPPSVAAIS